MIKVYTRVHTSIISRVTIHYYFKMPGNRILWHIVYIFLFSDFMLKQQQKIKLHTYWKETILFPLASGRKVDWFFFFLMHKNISLHKLCYLLVIYLGIFPLSFDRLFPFFFSSFVMFSISIIYLNSFLIRQRHAELTFLGFLLFIFL